MRANKLSDELVEQVKSWRLGGMSWVGARERLREQGVVIRVENLKKRCRKAGRVWLGGRECHEAWCALDVRRSRGGKRGLLRSVAKAVNMVDTPNNGLAPVETTGVRKPEVDLVPESKVRPVVEKVQPAHRPVVSSVDSTDAPAQVPRPPIVPVPAITESGTGAAGVISAGAEPRPSAPVTEPLVGVVASKVAEDTKEIVPVRTDGPVVHMPVSMPQKEVQGVSGNPAGHNTSEPVTPPGTAPTPIPHGTVPALDEPLGEPIPGRQGWVRGVDGVVRRETVRERKVRMLEVARTAQAEKAREEREKVEQAERDRLEKEEREFGYDEVRAKTYGPLWTKKTLPAVTEPKPGEPMPQEKPGR